MAEQGLVSFSSKLLWFIYPAAALLLVFAGWSFYSQQKLKKIIALLKAAEKERQESKETGTEISELLTRKEGEVYTLLMQNKSNKEIAGALFVEVSTVKTHINNINKKLNPLNRKNIKSSVPVN
ncbi:MAG: response regulator transcription factor [Bacteroidia bacterium]|nr:response regulator transcription factor [Bacteroidia bacterium]